MCFRKSHVLHICQVGTNTSYVYFCEMYYTKSIIIIISDAHIMLLKFPIILSVNSFLHLLFSKLFPEVMPGIGNLTCIFFAKLA